MNNEKKTILITGVAGFIGYHVCSSLIRGGFDVVGYDNLNNYYEVSLKKSRLKELEKILLTNNQKWEFIKGELEDNEKIKNIFIDHNPKVVIHLAAQAGVRHSLENPSLYINSNIVGFQNIIECCKQFNVKNFIYASSSSVYGGNKKTPYSEDDPVNHPISLYAATKKSNELLAHVYSELYGIQSIGLRFFTVYGPWGRPDMAPMIFTKAILSKKPIQIFNNGDMARDFTYIDDVVEAIMKLVQKPAIANKKFNFENPDASSSWAPHRIFNVGNSHPIKLLQFVSTLEDELKIKAIKVFREMQPGDVLETYADTKKLKSYINYSPSTSLTHGIKQFIKWYKEYYS